MRSEAIRLALQALLEQILKDPGVLDDALKEVERLAPDGGSGRFFLVVDFKDARRAWCQSHAIQTFRAVPASDRRSFDINPQLPPT